MFKDNYNIAFEHIKPDTTTKNRILQKIESAQNRKKATFNPAIPWRIGFAVVATVAIALSIIFIPNKLNIEINTDADVNTNALNSASSYDEIYELVKKSFFENSISSTYNPLTDDFIDTEENFASPTTKPGDKGSSSAVTAPSLNATDSSATHSETTTQVEGVDEADIVKTDGKYIYALYQNTLRVFKADGKNSKQVNTVTLPFEQNKRSVEMYLQGNILTVVFPEWNTKNEVYSSVTIYNVSNPSEIKQVGVCKQKGAYHDSRMIGKYVYLITICDLYTERIVADKPETFVPTIVCKDEETVVPADSIFRYDDIISYPKYTVISAFNTENAKLSSTVSLLGGTEHIYCSANNIIVANKKYLNIEPKETNVPFPLVTTTVSRIAIQNGKVEYKCSGNVDGYLENQFFMDEHNGYFRFVTTVENSTKTETSFANSKNSVVSYTNETNAKLTVLDNKLKEVGKITDVAKDERVYSVRFMGDIAFFVTFRQTDPLFSVDLSDPKNPKILDALKIPGFSEYLYPYGDGKLFGFGRDADETTGRAKELKLSMFDISNPANITESSKTLISGSYSSPALYDHKAMLVSPEKNLIGFTAYNNGELYYKLYTYKNDGFSKVASVTLPNNYRYFSPENCRGLFIGDDFYIFCYDSLIYLDMNNFANPAVIKFQ